MDRRGFLHASLAAGASLAVGRTSRAKEPQPVDPDASIADLQAAMKAGRATARSITEGMLARIESIDRRGPTLRAVIEANPDALAIADALDRERKAKGPRGPLHGVPVLVKDNIDTADRMHTTAGSLALADHVAKADAAVIDRLRRAGAVLLGKANLSEWANIRSMRAASGWSARGGQTRNPHVLDRSPSGSSSGSAAAVAAGLCTVAVGTETDGSITAPASGCGVVGIKPTVGLASRRGIVPIALSQDTAGPLARTVTDAAILLGALAGEDAADPITATARGRIAADLTKTLDPDGLRGARLGYARNLESRHPATDQLARAAIEEMRRRGATVIEVELPNTRKLDDPEMEVLLFELHAQLDAYLAAAASTATVRSIADVIAFNAKHADRELRFFGQELFERALRKGPLSSPDYVKALADCRRLARAEGIDAVMDAGKLDALVAPTTAPACPIDLVLGDHWVGGATTPAAVAGYPHVTVPMGFVQQLPVGISFFGRAWSEPLLLRLAFAYEQATRHRRAPRFLPALDVGGPT